MEDEPECEEEREVVDKKVALRLFLGDYDRPEEVEVQEEDGTWRNATILHRKDNPDSVVIWFGGEEYEGLGEGPPLTRISAEMIISGEDDKIKVRKIESGSDEGSRSRQT